MGGGGGEEGLQGCYFGFLKSRFNVVMTEVEEEEEEEEEEVAYGCFLLFSSGEADDFDAGVEETHHLRIFSNKTKQNKTKKR